jgi:hypothetical protein
LDNHWEQISHPVYYTKETKAYGDWIGVRDAILYRFYSGFSYKIARHNSRAAW